tara:strand:+ start:404 stop:640 length:237 start_codon:yes stop_codon:yes gene_type:complete
MEIKTEVEFYKILKDKIENKVGDKRNDFSNIKEISRATYYNIVNLSNGDKKSPRLSYAKLKRVCKEFKIPFKGVHFEM